jgi:hypothetical protein
MAGGHCFGFSVSALLFWAKVSDVVPFGAPAVARLNIAGNASLAHEIAYGYAFQSLPSVAGAKVAGSPRNVVKTLISSLNATGPLYTLGLVGEFGGGHAVTPYAVDRLARDRYAILVYDNNHPGEARKVMVDAKSNTWNYRAAVNPKTPGSVYKGNASTQTLFLLPGRPGLGVQSCPFCAPLGLPTLTSTLRSAANLTRRPALQSIRLQSSGPVDSHLLITDAAGRRLGFVRGKLVNEIPGARVVRVLVDGPATWRDRSEPQYEVPTGKRYWIKLSADAPDASRGRGSDAISAATVTVLEPGFVAAARRIALAAGQRARLTLSADGHTMSFARPRGGRQPLYVLGNAAPGANDYQWNIRNRRRSTGKPVPFSLDVADRTMRVTGGGTYDLSMQKIGDEVSTFTHDRLQLGAGVTGVFDYENWSEGESMPLTEIKDGRVIRRRELSDQSRSDTGGGVVPVAPPPAATTTRPDTTIVRSPSNRSNDASASFEFSATDDGSDIAGFECKLDSGGFAACASPKSYDSLADGSHTFSVRAIDRAGTGDDTPAQFTWLVDTTGPTLRPMISPTPTYLGATAAATPNATDGGTGVASQSCDSVSTSAAGDHSVRCSATDNAGNVTDVTVHYTVEYRIVGLFPPAPNTKWKAGQTVPIKIALADAAGVRISDGTAAELVADRCKVTFSASGAQTQSATCMKYDPGSARFIYNWKLGEALGPVTLQVGVDYGTGTTTPLSETITVIEQQYRRDACGAGACDEYGPACAVLCAYGPAAERRAHKELRSILRTS